LDVDSLASQFQTTFPDKTVRVFLMCDTSYAHWLNPVYERLTSLGYTNLTIPPIRDTHDILYPSVTLAATPPFSTPSLPQDTTILLISDPADALSTLLTYHALTSQIYLFAPSTSLLTLSSPSTNTLLRRRYVAVHKTRDAPTIGILVSTLGKQGYLPLISKLRSMILAKGKKPYLLSLGKINPAKLANFAECDSFVMIACPESSIVDSKVAHKGRAGD
jgi:diphthamide biosynthesis protein 2